MNLRKLFSIISIITLILISCETENEFKNPKDFMSFSQEFLLQQKSGNETEAFIDSKNTVKQDVALAAQFMIVGAD